MKMNYQSGDKLTNRYLSNDAFTSLKNKLGGRSITSLGNRKRNSYKIPNQRTSLFEYRSLVYKILVLAFLTIIVLYMIPQTRYMLHGFVASRVQNPPAQQAGPMMAKMALAENNAYTVAPSFLKTDEYVAKQHEDIIPDGTYAYDFFTNNVIGITAGNSSTTIKIKLFSDSGFKNNFLIEKSDILMSGDDTVVDETTSLDATSTATSTMASTTTAVTLTKHEKNNYESYVFEGLGYGQLIAKVPPKTEIKKDSYVYARTVEGLKPVAQIINVDEDNKSTFTIIYAQLITSPQNIYKVILN